MFNLPKTSNKSSFICELHNQVHRRKHDTGTSRYIIIVVYYSGPFQYATFLDTRPFSLGDPYRSAAFFDGDHRKEGSFDYNNNWLSTLTKIFAFSGFNFYFYSQFWHLYRRYILATKTKCLPGKNQPEIPHTPLLTVLYIIVQFFETMLIKLLNIHYSSCTFIVLVWIFVVCCVSGPTYCIH